MMDTLDAIGSARPRELVTVTGRVVSIEVQPSNAAPSLTARVSDGTGFVDAVFQGRRDIPGVTPGARIAVSGRLSGAGATPHMFNPRFELS